jgi:DNA topoisomerase VI subunit B
VQEDNMTRDELKNEIRQSISEYHRAIESWARYELKNEIRQSMSEYNRAIERWARDVNSSIKSPLPDLDDYAQRIMNAIDRFEGGKSK